jgi:hypothetical protein
MTSAPTAAGTFGQPFIYRATFSRALTGPYSATGLPPGLSIDASNGVISGMPGAGGTFQVTVGATNGAGRGTAPLSLTIAGAPPVISGQPASLTLAAGLPATFTVTASGSPAPTFQWRKNGAPIAGATTSTYTIANTVPADAGDHTVVVANIHGAVTSSAASLAIVSASPFVTTQPSGQTVIAGASITLAVTATGNPVPSYQWRRDGAVIAGATTASLALNSATREQAGSYTVTITNSAGTMTSIPALVVVTPANALTNLSVRTSLAGGQVLTVGAVVSGGAKTILVRAAGPALNRFGLAGIVDPRLELYITGALPSAANDDWPVSLAPTFASLAAFPFDNGSRDAALSQSLDSSFTVQARGTGPGAVLVEAYDVEGGLSRRLINLSARNRVGTGSDILIAGFAVAGTGTKQLLIRAVGPGLAAAFGVPGTLIDPRVQVFTSAGVAIASNDNWEPGLASTFTQVGAFALPPNSRDAALLITLDAGATYTVQVSGADGGTGEAVVEVYEVF